MKPEEILEQLKVFGNDQPLPKQALAEAARQRETVTPVLLNALDETYRIAASDDYENIWENPVADIASYGFFLLAQFREQEAFPKLLQFLTLDQDRLDIVLGDVLTEGMRNLLYSTYNGDLPSVQAIAANQSLDPFARGNALDVIAGLLQDGRLSRDDAVGFLREQLAALGGSDDDALFGAFLAKAIADSSLFELLEDVREAYRLEKIELDFMGGFADFFDDLYKGPTQEMCVRLIKDAAEELAGWACFQPDEHEEEPSFKELLSWNVGRNDPCPCGSGKKFKKCCLPKKEKILSWDTRLDMPRDTYPPLRGEGGRPGLRDTYHPEAIEVDRLAYQAMHKLWASAWRRRKVDRKTAGEARKTLWQAFEKFQAICAAEGLDTPETYDQKHMLHYFCREWLEELLGLLMESKDERSEAVSAVLAARTGETEEMQPPVQ